MHLDGDPVATRAMPRGRGLGPSNHHASLSGGPGVARGAARGAAPRRRVGPVLVISLWLHLTLLLLLVVTVHYGSRGGTAASVDGRDGVRGRHAGGAGAAESAAQRRARPHRRHRRPRRPPRHRPAGPAPPAPAAATGRDRTAATTAARRAAPTTAADACRCPRRRPPRPRKSRCPSRPPLAMVVPRPPSPPASRAGARQRPRRRHPGRRIPDADELLVRPRSAAGAPAARTIAAGAPNTLDFSLAPRQGATDNSPFSRVAGAHVGPDWRNELSAWVRAHAYYPEQAAMNGEDGDVMVQVVANPNGHVTSVEMKSRSGSQWLDMALMALFRDANLPPLHGESEPITFNFTMHYILIRMR